MDIAPGSHIRDACASALAEAVRLNEPVPFEFNGYSLTAIPTHAIGDLYAEWERLSGSPVLSPEAEREAITQKIEKMKREQADAISAAKVMTEAEMRDAKVPWPKSLEELSDYVKALTDRPHDYGTCCYAMSMAAVASYQYVAHVLGTTGFQAGCADMDIIRRNRGYEHGFKVIDFGNLLYPQYCDEQHFPHWDELIANNPDLRKQISDAAKAKIAESESHAHPEVLAHWHRLAKMA